MPRSIILDDRTLELLGLTQKDLDVYVALLALGSAPLRRIAEAANLNRGTAYDAIKHLIAAGLVTHVDAKTHRYFTGEDPHKLRGLATRREVELREARLSLDEAIVQLDEVRGSSEHRPAVRYYESDAGVREILEDVLAATERAETMTYRVYSSAALRDLIAGAWPSFTKERIRRGIRVEAISMGQGGTTAGLDARKWLTQTAQAPTYIFVYAGKTAFVSLDAKKQLFGVILENAALASTQTMIFEALWKHL